MTFKINRSIFALSFYFLCSVFYTFPLIFKMSTAIYGPFYLTDMRGTVWFSWWYKYAFEHGIDIYHCPLISAPYGLDFSGIPFFWASLETTRLLTIFTDPLFALNFLGLTALVFSAFIIYKLTYSLTRNRAGALISGFIFGFSPYHLNKLMEFSYVYVGVFLALYFFMLLRLNEKLSVKNVLLTGISFGLLFSFSLYYAFFAFIMSLLFMVFCAFFQWRDKIKYLFSQIGRGTIKNRFLNGLKKMLVIIIVFVIGYLINLPTTYSLTQKLIFKNTSAVSSEADFLPERPISYLVAQSARPLSYLLPAHTHPVFGNFTRKMFGSIFYGRGHIEQTLYLGWIPLILAFLGFKEWKRNRSSADLSKEYQKSSDNFIIGLCIFMSVSAFLISMAPYLDIGFFKIYFPSFFLHKIFPAVRAYARFGVIVSLFITILAGYGLRSVFSKIKNLKIARFIACFIFGLIFFEYLNVPPWRTTQISEAPEIYKWLSEQPGDFIIAEYPMPVASVAEAPENYDYLYYQTFHHKRLVNGALYGTQAYKIRQSIIKIEDDRTVPILKTLGVKYVILHPGLYKTGSFKEAVDVIGSVPDVHKIKGLRPVKVFGEDIACEII